MTETRQEMNTFPAEAADPHCVGPEESDLLLRDAPWRRYAVIGDSLAEGLGDPSPGYRGASWADRVATALGRVQPDLAYLNLGVRGLTSAEVRRGQLEEAVRFGPDLACVVCGGNDLLQPGFSPDAVAAELDTMVSALSRSGATVFVYALMDVTAAVPELRGGPLDGGLRLLNGLMRDVAARHEAVVVDMDVHPAVGERDLFSADLIHASMRGHAVIAGATLRALGARLARTAS